MFSESACINHKHHQRSSKLHLRSGIKMDGDQDAHCKNMRKEDAIIQFIKNRWTSPYAIIIYFALIKLLIHLFTNGQYGYFRDELYFLACSEHLDWGYVDFAPLVAVITKLSLMLVGNSLSAIRFLPAVAGALLIVLTGLIVTELGGKRFAVMLGCLCVLVAPIYLAFDTLLSMNAFEPLFWLYDFLRDIPRDVKYYA